MNITVGQLVQAAQLLSVDLAQPGLPDFSNLSQDAVLGEDVLTIVAVFWPPAALIEDALVVAIALAPLLVKIHVTPDPNPVADAQTTETPHTGRNG